ncbi:MAG: hypothetical protein ACR2LY_06045 [Thermoleophilaceae bacterium]
MNRLRSLLPALIACALVAFAALLPGVATAQSGGASPSAGDERRSPQPRTRDREAAVEDAEEVDSERRSDADSDAPASAGRPAGKARIVGGQAVAPANAPAAVKTAIAAANKIAHLPYRYGGGHGKVEDTAYDCSGAISYALIKAGLLPAPLASGPFMQWGEPGAGRWITVYAHGGHAFVVIAGLRFDTGFRGRESALSGTTPGKGPRWGYARPTAGFVARHPAGL